MDSFEKYYTHSLKYLSLRQRSEKEIVEYLKKKKAPEDIVQKIVSKLKEHRFLNDALFAKLWVESRNRTKPRSEWLLSRELEQKGVAKSVIKKLFENTRSKDNDLSFAKQALERRITKYKGLPRNEIYQKLGGFLARRGFDWETCKRAIDDLLKEGYNTRE